MDSKLLIGFLKNCITLFFVLLFSSSLLIAQKKDQSIFTTKRDKVEISDMELRLRLTDFFIRYLEIVEKTADRIYYDTSDPEIKKAALMWKIYGISAMNKAVNMPDPIASFYNAWPLSKQLIIFFSEGPGKEGLGSYHDQAVEICIAFEARLDEMITDMISAEHHSDVEPRISRWAEAHPIEDFYFARESTMSIFAQWIGEGNYGIGKSVKTITEEVIELSNQLNLYVDLVPRQARWQADYALLEYMQDSSLLYNLSTMVSSVDRMAHTVEKMPEVIEYNREATMRDLDEQREKSLRLLIDERIAVISEIRKERIDVVDKIIEERMIVLDEMKKERAIVLADIRDISEQVVQLSGSEIERITDKVLWRMTIASIIMAIALIITVVLYKKL